jgi:hypothetical protein
VSHIRAYLAAIGRRGGIKSRRALDSETAKRMVAMREARRVARSLAAGVPASALDGSPSDTSAPAQAIQDALQR